MNERGGSLWKNRAYKKGRVMEKGVLWVLVALGIAGLIFLNLLAMTKPKEKLSG